MHNRSGIIQRTNISHFFHFNLKLAWLSWMKISKNTCKIASFPYFFIFSLKSALLIFIDENTKNKHFPFFFHINLKSALLSSMKITKNTCKIASFPIFSTLTLNRFYLFSALPIFSIFTLCHLYLFSSMKIQVLLHFHIFSTLTLSGLYLFSSMKIPSIFFILLGVKLLLT